MLWSSPGKVSLLEDAALDSFLSQMSHQDVCDSEDSRLKLVSHDIYKELRLRGYDYKKDFQGILESTNAGTGGFPS